MIIQCGISNSTIFQPKLNYPFSLALIRFLLQTQIEVKYDDCPLPKIPIALPPFSLKPTLELIWNYLLNQQKLM